MSDEPEAPKLEGEWRADPTGRHGYRLWDGSAWTDQVSNFGVRSSDPFTLGDEKAAPLRGGAISRSGAPVALPTRREPVGERRGPTSSTAKTVGGVLTLVGGLLLALGAVMPIFPDSTRETTYFSIDNQFDLRANEWVDSRGVWAVSLGLAIALLALGILNRQSSRLPTVLALVLSITMLGLVSSDYRDLGALTDLGWTSGLTVCLIGTLASSVGSITALVAQSTRRN